jgi:hypothetical protein
MPAMAVATATTPAATTEVICSTGELSCKAREWSTGTAEVEDITIGCYACDSDNAACTNAES